MRSSKLAVVVVAAAASLIPTAAVASAAPRHRHAGRLASGCSVRLTVAPRRITSGESALAFGYVRCANSSEEDGQTVTLYQASAPSSTYSVAGTGTSKSEPKSEAGYFEIPVSPLTTNSSFYATAAGAQSAYRNVKVSAQVEVKGPPEGVVPDELRTGRPNRVTFTGTVSPADEGALLVLQRQNAVNGNEWHRIGLGVVGTGGRFSITHRFVVPGDANLRVVVRSGVRNIPSASNILSYEIVQAQNKELTIESSADPISYGQSVTISGTLAAPANTAVTLLARSALQSGYVPVGEVKTNGSDDYTFPAQVPLANTYYRVEGAGKSSAVLYEAVKYVLTAGVSNTTVESGQPLTFSGTVTPGETGHVVYLERENAGGLGGFHVIEVGTVNSGGTYSIVHTFYGLGTDVVRIKIPGGPLNGTSDSQTFTIPVTPAASPATIAPEAPGNSTSPPEGQL
jgi:hypothetical protein